MIGGSEVERNVTLILAEEGHIPTCNHGNRLLHLPGTAANKAHGAQPEEDVEFIVQGVGVRGSRAQLSRHCTFFYNMFRQGVFRESRAKVIELKNVNLQAMKLFLKLVHVTEGDCEELTHGNHGNTNLTTLLELFELVDMFQHTPLICWTVQQIKHSVQIENCCTVLEFAHKYVLPEVADRALDTAISNLAAVSRCEAYVRAHVRTIQTILSHDKVNISAEVEVLEAAVRWYHSNRDMHVFNAVRFILIPREQLVRYHHTVDLHTILKHTVPISTSQRRNLQCLYVIGGVDLSYVEVYNIQTKDWRRGPSLPAPQHAACSATLNNRIYVIGGFVNGRHSNVVLQLTLGTNKWLPGQPHLQPRSGAGAAVLDGKIYVCGGRNEEEALASCEMYDSTTNAWSFVDRMQTARTYHGQTATSTAIYVIGGISADKGCWTTNFKLQTVERYCVFSKQWSYIGPLSLSLMSPGCACVNDIVYICGGRSLSHTVIGYDQNISSYIIKRAMMEPRGQGVKAVSVGNMLYCIGGCPGFGTLRSMERFDTVKGIWCPLPSKSFSQGSACFAVL